MSNTKTGIVYHPVIAGVTREYENADHLKAFKEQGWLESAPKSEVTDEPVVRQVDPVKSETSKK